MNALGLKDARVENSQIACTDSNKQEDKNININIVPLYTEKRGAFLREYSISL